MKAFTLRAPPSHPGRGGYLTTFNTGRLRPGVQPLTLLYTILAEKVPLSHTYLRKSCSHFHVVLNIKTDTTIRDTSI